MVGYKARTQKPFDFVLTSVCHYDLKVQGDPTINKKLTKYKIPDCIWSIEFLTLVVVFSYGKC